mgnify:FL=1
MQQIKKLVNKSIAIFTVLGILALINFNNIVKMEDKKIILAKAEKEIIEIDKEWLKDDFWEWHTRTTTSDKAYNGRHIKLGQDIVFYGYGDTSYKDFLYKEYKNAGEKIFTFTVDESQANYHTLDGAGFIFNSTIQDNKLSGYVLLYREKDICIYRLDNVDINKFENTSDKVIADYGKLVKTINKTSDVIHNLVINTSPTNVKVIDNNKEILNLNLDSNAYSGESFGLISSYLQHDCSILSTIVFKYFKLEINDYKIPVVCLDEKSEPLKETKFYVKNEKGEIVRECISDENGSYDIEGLTEGTYTIEEVKTQKTYKFKITREGKVIDINTNKEIKLILKHEPFEIPIINYIKDTKIGISGSKIGLYNKNGEPILDKDGKQITIITNNDGKGTFIGIEPGEYIYKQIEVSADYIKDEKEYKCIVNMCGEVEYESNNGIIYNAKIEEKLPEILPQTGERTITGIVCIAIVIIICSIIKLNKFKEI